jgi:hypothetical protein
MTQGRRNSEKNGDSLEPLPVGEVQESDWAEWEDSVAFQDSQTGGFADSVQPTAEPPSEEQADAFSSVKKHDA